MEVSIEKKEKVWRGRGRPRRVVPKEIRDLADATYQTGNVGRVELDDTNDEEVRELIRLLESYADSLGRRMRIQRDDFEVRFEMVDRGRRGAAA
jgi:hypothetical protein